MQEEILPSNILILSKSKILNPVIVRFTQEDRYRGDGLNLYAYCDNNPINYIDPTGYSSKRKENRSGVFGIGFSLSGHFMGGGSYG